jgi:hypothetical protein
MLIPPRYARTVRILPALVAFACLVGASTAAGASSTPAAPIPVTFVGDSISASISYVPSARRKLEGGLAVRLDAKVCRRLVQPSCTFQGTTPLSALEAVQSYGRSLGRVLVVSVGYNEDGRGYAQGIDLVLRAALAQGASGVVWVTLRESGQYGRFYARINAAIRQTAKRRSSLHLADWNEYSAGKPWFGSDGLHLNPRGATSFAVFLRSYVFAAARSR